MKLINIYRYLKQAKGFTLLELLIVVALLGALFIGLLATLDPLEQINRGTDTARRNIVSEIYGAAINYYALKGDYPWQNDIVGMAASDVLMTTAPDGYINKFIETGELKSDFITLAGSGNLNKIFLTSRGDANGIRKNVAVCFLPESKSIVRNTNAQYDVNGDIAAGCLSTDPAGTPCYICVK